MMVLLMSFNSGLVFWFGPAETSYTETYFVKAGTSAAASGGRLGYSHTSASGVLTVSSCCGQSTNDIIFVIENEVSGRRDFGVVVGTFNFEWNTGNYSEYSMIFGNNFDPTSSSYHDKTVEISVTEVGPPSSTNLLFVLELAAIAAIVVASISIGLILLLLRRRKRKHLDRAPSSHLTIL